MHTQDDTSTRPTRWLDLIRASGDRADMGRAITRLATLAAAAHRGRKAEVRRLRSEVESPSSTSAFLLPTSDFPRDAR